MTGSETHYLPDAGGIPNSPLPVLVYRDADEARDASECEALFARNGWLGAWVDGIYSFHHFHSTTAFESSPSAKTEPSLMYTRARDSRTRHRAR